MEKLFWLDDVPSRWVRFFAKCIDYSLFYMVVSLISLFVPYYFDDIYYVGLALATPILWAPIEAFLIAKYKTTIGKLLFGVRIENHVGGRLPYLIALKRSFFWGVRPGVMRQKELTKARWTVGILVFCLLASSAVFEKEITEFTTGFEKYKTADGWIQYTSSHGGFRVIFPQDPEEESKLLPVPAQKKTLNYNELKSYQTQKVYYTVSYMELPRKWKLAGTSRLLQGALDVIIEHTPNSKLLYKQFTKHKNYRALDFHSKQGDEEVQGRLILVGTTLFRLTVVYPPSLAHQLQHHEFLDSFEIQKG
jgi:uncharacterized RDD family membrane protein YckC